VDEFVKPENFDYFHQVVEEMIFRNVASGPMVRSSYQTSKFLSWAALLDAVWAGSHMVLVDVVF
jgi:lipoate synthase